MIISFPDNYQRPNKTELDSLNQFKSYLTESNKKQNVVYVAFPWAEFIDISDQIAAPVEAQHDPENNKEIYSYLLNGYNYIKERISNLGKDVHIFTSCQHVWAFTKASRHLFKNLNIKTIFWSHLPRETNSNSYRQNHLLFKKEDLKSFKETFNILPYYLYPVQVPNTISKEEYFSERSTLISFQGAKGNEWYLDNVREKISKIPSDDLVNIILKDNWHYQDIIFAHKNDKNFLDNAYINLLKNSEYTLCPIGTGHNSIRLWEAINTGTIPVFVDNHPELYEVCDTKLAGNCIFIRSHDLKDIKQILLNNKKNLSEMRKNLYKISLKFTSNRITNLQRYYEKI